jgi:exodeoxyribonuclease VII large subunit
VRFRRRHARADADRGGRAGGAGARRAARLGARPRRAGERCARRNVERGGEQLAALLRHWPAREDLLAPQQQRLDELGERLPRALRGRLDRARGELGHAAGALRPGLLVSAHARARERLDALWRVAQLAHPNRPLERGYARVEDREGRTLISVAAACEARLLRLHFHDGPVDASVGDAGGGAVERPRRAPYLKTKADQPKLL